MQVFLTECKELEKKVIRYTYYEFENFIQMILMNLVENELKSRTMMGFFKTTNLFLKKRI